MGFLGLFVGPVLMALLVAIWREWMREATAPTETSVNEIIKG
jgi:predicted PurR-regulated permease PerM